MYCLHTETGTQALDESGCLRALAAALLTRLPQAVRLRSARCELAVAHLAAPHRLGQRKPCGSLAEQRAQLLRVRLRCGELQHAARRRCVPVPQAAFERGDAALARREKPAQILDERRERGEHGCMMLELVGEGVACAKALRRLKSAAQIDATSHQM